MPAVQPRGALKDALAVGAVQRRAAAAAHPGTLPPLFALLPRMAARGEATPDLLPELPLEMVERTIAP